MSAQQTLYNKYRPQTFAEVVDQNHIKITLQNEIAGDKLAHAYLFTGPRGVGKTTVARILAKSINCEKRKKGDSEPCNKCAACDEVNQAKSLDLVEVDAASQTKVDQTRENIIAASRISATAGRTKIFIIDEVHMLSTASFNALLKTLEEPPAKVFFILATTEVHKVPETIISRCQRFDFHRLGVEDLIKWMDNICQLEGIRVKKDVLTAIAVQAEGGARDALSLLGQILTLSDKEVTYDQASLVLPRSDWEVISKLVDHLIDKKPGQAIDLLNKALSEGIDLNQLIKNMIEYLRQMLLLKITSNKEKLKLDLDKSAQKAIIKQGEKVTVDRLVYMLDILLEKFQQIKLSTIPQLPIELAFILICNNGDNEGDGSDINPGDLLSSEPDKNKSNQENDQKPMKQEKSTAKSKLKLSDIQDKWSVILRDLKQYNHSLSAFMKVARPISLEAGEFKIGFQYSFHNEILHTNNNKRKIEDIISKHVGGQIFINGQVDEDYEKREVWLVQSNDNKDKEVKAEEPEVDVATAFS